MCATSALSHSLAGPLILLHALPATPLLSMHPTLTRCLLCWHVWTVILFVRSSFLFLFSTHSHSDCASQTLTFPMFVHTHIIYKSGSFYFFAVPTLVSIFLLALSHSSSVSMCPAPIFFPLFCAIIIHLLHLGCLTCHYCFHSVHTPHHLSIKHPKKCCLCNNGADVNA